MAWVNERETGSPEHDYKLLSTKTMHILDFITECCKWAFIALSALIGFVLLGIAGAQMIENWNAEEYPYSGFQPDCPTWDEPLDDRYLPRPQQDEEEAE